MQTIFIQINIHFHQIVLYYIWCTLHLKNFVSLHFFILQIIWHVTLQITKHLNHINDNLVTMDDKADITHYITGVENITVIVQAWVTRKVDHLSYCWNEDQFFMLMIWSLKEQDIIKEREALTPGRLELEKEIWIL